MSLDDPSYGLLWELSRQTGVPPEFFLIVMASESGLRPCIQSGAPACGQPGKYDYWGLNQIDGAILRANGINPQDYLTWPASEQLRRVIIGNMAGAVNIVAGWTGHPPQSPGVVHAINFCSGALKNGDGPDAVLASKDGSRGQCSFGPNAGLDYDKNGVVTVSDLDAMLCDRIINTDWIRGEIKKLYADPAAQGKTPAPLCQVAAPSISKPPGWLLIGLVAGGLGYVTRETWMPAAKRVVKWLERLL
jgi:hypothetical protein